MTEDEAKTRMFSDAFREGAMGALFVICMAAIVLAVVGTIYSTGYNDGLVFCGLAGKP